MGLDGVEIVLATEETFAVTLDDSEAGSASTPKDVINLVCSKLGLSTSGCSKSKECMSQRAYYVLRNAFCQVTNTPRKSMRPDKLIKELIPSKEIKQLWPDIGKALNATKWPSLCRQQWVTNTMIGVVLGAIVASLLVLPIFGVFDRSNILLITIGVAFLTGCLSTLATRRMKTYLPGYDTLMVRDLISNAYTSGDFINPWTSREAVAEAFKQIVIDQLGLKPEEYYEDAHFVKDLGMD